LPEWLYEEGIGENRAILVEDEAILEALVEVHDEPRVGAIVAGRYRDFVRQWGHGWISTADGEILVREIPRGLTKGQAVRVEILREEMLERDTAKAVVGRITDEPERDGPTLAERIGIFTKLGLTGADRFEAAGWHDLIEEAISGEIPFPSGELLLSLTPAMTLIDVNGWLAPAELARAGATAAGKAIRRHGITGSIGIDLPTVSSRVERQNSAASLDAVLPQPFERTAVNGFGFLQVVRKRERQSLPELMQHTPIASAARALLRRAERVPGLGARRITASPAVVDYLERRSEWLDELRHRIGTNIELQAKSTFTTWGCHVQSIQS
jgi:hypothetical protein